MPRSYCSQVALSLCLAVFAMSSTALRAEQGAESLPAPVAVIPSLTPAQLAVLQYAYVDSLRALDAAAADVALAEAHVTYLRQRVASYAPFRSLGQYSAAYSADRCDQLKLLAAEQGLALLRQRELDLWRQRQTIAAAMMRGDR